MRRCGNGGQDRQVTAGRWDWLTDDEVRFYDALVNNDSAVRELSLALRLSEGLGPT